MLYPAEVFDDEDITATAIRLRPERVSFLCGWNLCTDLYRLLEHADDTIRTKHELSTEEPGGVVTAFLARPQKHFSSDILHLVSKLLADLPEALTKIKAETGDPQLDRYGFIGRPLCTGIVFTRREALLTNRSFQYPLHDADAQDAPCRWRQIECPPALRHCK